MFHWGTGRDMKPAFPFRAGVSLLAGWEEMEKDEEGAAD